VGAGGGGVGGGGGGGVSSLDCNDKWATWPTCRVLHNEDEPQNHICWSNLYANA